jgi:hypothetical protein
MEAEVEAGDGGCDDGEMVEEEEEEKDQDNLKLR